MYFLCWSNTHKHTHTHTFTHAHTQEHMESGARHPLVSISVGSWCSKVLINTDDSASFHRVVCVWVWGFAQYGEHNAHTCDCLLKNPRVYVCVRHVCN